MNANKLFFFFLAFNLFCWSKISFAQTYIVIGSGVAGSPSQPIRYTDVEGSAFFNEEWQDGLVKLADGKMYYNLKLKYDQVVDKVFFLGEKDVPMAFKLPVLEFKISNQQGQEVYFVNGYGSIDGADEKTYYQKLGYQNHSKVELLKKTNKKVYENRLYNSAVTTKTIEPFVSYYLCADGKNLKKIKLDNKSIISALGNKQVELEKYIKEYKLNLKQEEDVVKLLTYYGTIIT